MQHILQHHTRDCGVAALAMAVGKTYEEVVSFFPDNDFNVDGLFHTQPWKLLWEWGYSIRVVFQSFNGVEKSPWPSPPFAPMHFVQVRVKHDSPVDHYVVMDGAGKVFDPLTTDAKQLTDYARINHIVGIWNRAE